MSNMEFEEASAEIQQMGLGRSISLARPTRPRTRAASPSTELLTLTRTLGATHLVSPCVSPRRSVDRSAADDCPSDGGEYSMEESFEDFSCPESFDDDVTISGPVSRYCVSLLHVDDEDSSSGDEHLYYAPSSPMKRATLHPQHVGAAKSSLGRRSRSEDQLPRISIDAAPQSSFTSAPSPSGQQQWDDALREISGEIPPDHIRNKLRSNSFSRDDATLCLGQAGASTAFERDKENHFNFRNGGSAGLGLPGDGSSAGTMITVGIPRHHSSLRVATDRAQNSPIATRRAKSVPVRPNPLPELRLEGSGSYLTGSPPLIAVSVLTRLPVFQRLLSRPLRARKPLRPCACRPRRPSRSPPPPPHPGRFPSTSAFRHRRARCTTRLICPRA